MPEIQEEEIDLREYINVLLKRKVIIILIFLIAVITAAIVSYFVLQPVYQANTVITVLKPKIGNSIVSEPSLEDYKNLITDNALEEELIQKLNLNEPPHELTPYDLNQMLAIELPKGTNLIKMSLQASSPKLTKDIINAWATLFVEKNKRLYFNEVTKAKTDIEEKFKLAEQEFFEIEEKLMKFNETNNIDVIGKEITAKLDKIIANESRLFDIKTNIETGKAKIEEIEFQMNSEKKLISSFNLNKLIEGMSLNEANNFTESQLELAKQILKIKEEELKTFNQESKISFLEKEITSKTNQIVNFANSLINLKALIEQEKTRVVTMKAQLNKQEKTFILTKSIYDDASLSHMVSKISEEEALLLKNLKLKSEELNSLYLNLEERIINSEINLEIYQTEMVQVTGNIDILENELKKAKSEYAIEELKLVNLEREYKIAENTFIMLANKIKEIEMAVATPKNQDRIIQFTNPEYLSLQKQLTGLVIAQKAILAEEKQLHENIDFYSKRVSNLKKELTEKKLILAHLDREYCAKEILYNNILQQAEELRLSVVEESDLLKISSIAYEPKVPITPNKKLNILIAGVLGLFVGVFVAFFLEFWQKGK